jgi:hypothetical protein
MLSVEQIETIERNAPGTRLAWDIVRRKILTALVEAGGTMTTQDLSRHLHESETMIDTVCQTFLAVVPTLNNGGQRGYRVSILLAEKLGLAPVDVPTLDRVQPAAAPRDHFADIRPFVARATNVIAAEEARDYDPRARYIVAPTMPSRDCAGVVD